MLFLNPLEITLFSCLFVMSSVVVVVVAVVVAVVHVVAVVVVGSLLLMLLNTLHPLIIIDEPDSKCAYCLALLSFKCFLQFYYFLFSLLENYGAESGPF